jgi:hypothetical protein
MAELRIMEKNEKKKNRTIHVRTFHRNRQIDNSKNASIKTKPNK